MAVERDELELVWPPALFAAEARTLLTDGEDDEQTAGWLMAEAFHRDRGWLYFQERTGGDAISPHCCV